eukprot:m.215283 g.215283  ORF g.215283 m.215283 type:complete len:507 (-) comp26204_c0_seq2:51-1571(-)
MKQRREKLEEAQRRHLDKLAETNANLEEQIGEQKLKTDWEKQKADKATELNGRLHMEISGLNTEIKSKTAQLNQLQHDLGNAQEENNKLQKLKADMEAKSKAQAAQIQTFPRDGHAYRKIHVLENQIRALKKAHLSQPTPTKPDPQNAILAAACRGLLDQQTLATLEVFVFDEEKMSILPVDELSFKEAFESSQLDYQKKNNLLCGGKVVGAAQAGFGATSKSKSKGDSQTVRVVMYKIEQRIVFDPLQCKLSDRFVWACEHLPRSFDVTTAAKFQYFRLNYGQYLPSEIFLGGKIELNLVLSMKKLSKYSNIWTGVWATVGDLVKVGFQVSKMKDNSETKFVRHLDMSATPFIPQTTEDWYGSWLKKVADEPQRILLPGSGLSSCVPIHTVINDETTAKNVKQANAEWNGRQQQAVFSESSSTSSFVGCQGFRARHKLEELSKERVLAWLIYHDLNACYNVLFNQDTTGKTLRIMVSAVANITAYGVSEEDANKLIRLVHDDFEV